MPTTSLPAAVVVSLQGETGSGFNLQAAVEATPKRMSALGRLPSADFESA